MSANAHVVPVMASTIKTALKQVEKRTGLILKAAVQDGRAGYKAQGNRFFCHGIVSSEEEMGALMDRIGLTPEAIQMMATRASLRTSVIRFHLGHSSGPLQ